MRTDMMRTDAYSDSGAEDPDATLFRYHALRKEQPALRARQAAAMLGVSEAELLAAQCGNGIQRLVSEPERILSSLEPLGELMALTRNEHCVHERKGIYQGGRFMTHGAMRQGLFVNPDIDLRLFLQHWCSAFACTEGSQSGTRRSLQFFDRSGMAAHKIYLTQRSDVSAWNELVTAHLAPVQERSVRVSPYPEEAPAQPDEDVDLNAYHAAWASLKDTHDFFPLLRKFRLNRLQALRLAEREYAWQVAVTSPRQVLELARDMTCPIMVFVGNRGCIQIHTGTVNKLVAQGPWYNVLDPMFNLHLREDAVHSCWVTRKPTVDGIVSALEVFSAEGELILTLFGQRKPGQEELPAWRSIIEHLPASLMSA